MMISIIVGILFLGGVLFFLLLSYTSPVNEAGREYRKNVRAYKNVEIETMDDVFERLEVLDSHFDSTTFNKVQGGEKREVTLSDIVTLFGEADQMVEDVDGIDTVYQYHYEDITLNIHQHFSDIDEYVIENEPEVVYDLRALDRLFIDTISNHHSQFNKENGEFAPILEEMVSPLIMNKPPTRKLRQNGWSKRSSIQQYYFDDGRADDSPKEYLLLHFNKNHEDVTELRVMGRHYNETNLEIDTKEEVERKEQALWSLTEALEARESSSSDETLIVEDFSRELGEIASMMYDFRTGILQVSWLIKDGEDTEEIMAKVPITDGNKISDIDDLAGLEVVDFSSQMSYGSELNKDEFNGSK